MDKNKAILLGIIAVVIAVIVGIAASRKRGESPAVDKSQQGTTQTGGQTPGTSAPTAPPPSGQTGSSQESVEAVAAIKDAQSLSNDLGGMNSSANQFNENEEL